MGLPLEIKVKKAVAAYLASLGAPELAGYKFFRGLRSGLQTLPSVCVGLRERDPLRPSVVRESAWKCRLEVCVESKVTFVAGNADASADAHSEAVSAVEEAIFPQLICPYVNSEGVTRPVPDFHLHGSFGRPRVESYYDQQRSAWVSALVFDLIVDNRDGDTPRSP